VLQKALARGLAPLVVLNKVDRPAATQVGRVCSVKKMQWEENAAGRLWGGKNAAWEECGVGRGSSGVKAE
jgi:hypothetical protein